MDREDSTARRTPVSPSRSSSVRPARPTSSRAAEVERPRSRERPRRGISGDSVPHPRASGSEFAESMQDLRMNRMTEEISHLTGQMRQLMDVVTVQQQQLGEIFGQQQQQANFLQSQVAPPRPPPIPSSFGQSSGFGPGSPAPMPNGGLATGLASSAAMPNGGSFRSVPFVQRDVSPARSDPILFPASSPQAAENPFSSPSTLSNDPDLHVPGGAQHSPVAPPPPPVVNAPGAGPRLVLPDGTSFELGPATPGGQNGGQPGGANQLDAFQKSDKCTVAVDAYYRR